MRATSNVSVGTISSNGFLSVGQISARYGCHVNSVRRWVDQGKLSAAISPGGHRRIRTTDIESLLGLSEKENEEKENGGGGKVALLGRTSTSKQGQNYDTTNNQKRDPNGKESDLERQVAQLKEYSQEKYGVAGEVFSDIGSGLNYERKNFVRLLEEVCQGKWRGGTVIVTHKDRAMRFGFELLEIMCRVNQVTIDIMDRQTEISDENEMSDDILSIITHFSAKKHGLRASISNTCTLPTEAIELSKELKDKGYPILQIAKVLKNEGYTMVNGRGKIKPISVWALYKLFGNGQGKMLELALPKEDNEGTSFDVFAKEHLTTTNVIEDRTFLSKIKEAYHKYCKEHDLIKVSHIVIGKWLRLNTIKKAVFRGGRVYYGIVLTATN